MIGNSTTSISGNEEGNRNMFAYSNSMNLSRSFDERLIALMEEIDMVILLADKDKKIAIVHNPKNFGGTRTRPTNKIACLIGWYHN